jgi:heat-inducible transcriptional repressor
VLGLLVTSNGVVEKRLLKLKTELPRERVLEIANYLSSKYSGLDLAAVVADIEAWSDSPAGTSQSELEQQARTVARSLLDKTSDSTEVQVAGTDKLLQSEDFAQIERVRSLMAALENEKNIVREIRRALATRPTQVIIGRESEVTASGELGIVTTLFFKDGQRAGAVGVVGPRRMDYARIVPMVEYIGDSLTKMLQGPGALNG